MFCLMAFKPFEVGLSTILFYNHDGSYLFITYSFEIKICFVIYWLFDSAYHMCTVDKFFFYCNCCAVCQEKLLFLCNNLPI